VRRIVLITNPMLAAAVSEAITAQNLAMGEKRGDAERQVW
jgi:hypothetical protein